MNEIRGRMTTHNFCAARCLVLLVIWAYLHCSTTSFANFFGFELPAAPPKTSVAIYFPLKFPEAEVAKMPVIAAPQNVRDAKGYLESLGIKFRDGGFALFIPSTSVLVVAASEDTHSSIIVVFD